METENERLFIALVVEHIPALASREKILLLRQCRGADDFRALSRKDVYALAGKAAPPEKNWTIDDLFARAERDMILLKRDGAAAARFDGEDYPPLLRELYDPPSLLFYRGPLFGREENLAAIVGTRKPTGAGQEAAFEAARFLGRNGVSVVSGLALGIDAAAHRGNLAGGGKTVAVLGSGLDRVYPAGNRDLARRILLEGGVLVSEYPPETPPFRWHFPARNRIIAGLSRGTIVAEAPEKSGAGITAQFALDMGRDLWVLRAGFDSPRGAGVRRLAEEGAPVIEHAGVILEEWGMKQIDAGGKGPLARVPDGEAGGPALARLLAEKLRLTGEDGYGF
jgi:DNA processing protein